MGHKEEVVSSTPSPVVEVNSAGFSTPSPLGVEISSAGTPNLNINAVESSTAAPIADFSTAGPLIDSSSLGFSSPAPSLGFVSSTPAPSFLNALGFSSYSTPAPLLPGSGSLTHLDSALFNNDAALNGAPVITSGGSIFDAFGVSTIAPPVHAIVHHQGEPQVKKNVYFFAAPEETEPVRPRFRIASPATEKKNINYIFIKAPVPAPVGPIRVEAPIKQEEKTVVYVLVKKPQEEQEIEIQTPEPVQTPKPEVYFIKYKDQHEAEEAIHKVQTGQASPSEQVSANNVHESNSFISELDRSNYNIQPLVSEAKYPISNLNSGLFYSTTAAPFVGSDFNLRTFAPSFNSFTASTPAPIFNTFSNAVPKLNPFLGSSFTNVVGDLPVGQNLLDVQFSSSTVAPESFVSSTVVPPAFASGVIETSTSSPFAEYGPPLIKKKK